MSLSDKIKKGLLKASDLRDAIQEFKEVNIPVTNILTAFESGELTRPEFLTIMTNKQHDEFDRIFGRGDERS